MTEENRKLRRMRLVSSFFIIFDVCVLMFLGLHSSESIWISIIKASIPLSFFPFILKTKRVSNSGMILISSFLSLSFIIVPTIFIGNSLSEPTLDEVCLGFLVLFVPLEITTYIALRWYLKINKSEVSI